MAARSFLSAYVLIGVLNVVAELTGNVDGVLLTKPLLIPLLIGWLVASARRTWPRPLIALGIGLLFAWAGDLFLLGEGDTMFILGIAAFLVMQVLYIVAFLSVPGTGILRRWPITAVPYAAALIAIVALTWPGAGGMRIPGVVYVVVLMTMAATALDLVGRLLPIDGWRVAAGGALFALSDALIALTAFGPLTTSPGTGAAVMTTYIIAQGLIVVGLTRGVLTPDRRVPTWASFTQGL